MQPCEQKDTINEIHDRLHKGDMFMQAMDMKLDTIIKKQMEHQAFTQKLHDRLYVDNGTRSIQTVQHEHSQVIRGLLWIVGISVTALVGYIIWEVLNTWHNHGG